MIMYLVIEIGLFAPSSEKVGNGAPAERGIVLTHDYAND